MDLDKMQSDYKAAVETWISAIRHEEALASVNHSVAEIDKWELENADKLRIDALKELDIFA